MYVCPSLKRRGTPRFIIVPSHLSSTKEGRGTGLFSPMRLRSSQPPRPALDQFRYYRVERKLATHPNVLTTSFRYGDKSTGVDTTHGCRNRGCRGLIFPLPPDFGRYESKTFSLKGSRITTCPTRFLDNFLPPCNPINRRTLAKFDFFSKVSFFYFIFICRAGA